MAARVLGLDVECVSYCDSWQPARDWAAANHGLPAAAMRSDVLTRPPLPADLDLCVAGPPCQAWSAAGKGGGLADPRGPMWQFAVDAI
eukprot:5516417-Alexandrium_andersonii.AAC.1